MTVNNNPLLPLDIDRCKARQNNPISIFFPSDKGMYAEMTYIEIMEYAAVDSRLH